MKIERIVKQLITDVTPCMHQIRRKSLQASMTNLMSGVLLSVTSVGRHITSKTSEKHQIKRSMRLCSNKSMRSEADAFDCCRLILAGRPFILINWNRLSVGQIKRGAATRY